MSSTRADLAKALTVAERLLPYEPKSRRKPRRGLYLTQRAVAELSNSAAQILVGRGNMLAAMDQWTLGGRIHGTKRRGEFVVPLAQPPPDVWEIKVRAPSVQARLFVRFVDPDMLMLTHCHTRQYLEREGAFEAAMTECVQAWEYLLPGHAPFRGNSIHEYITENCDDFPHEARPPKRR